jgi:hypothetical protein
MEGKRYGLLGDRMARLCIELDAGLEEVAEDAGAAELLTDIVAGMRSDADPHTLEVSLERLDEALRVSGIPGGLGTYWSRSLRDYIEPRGLSGGQAVEELFVCPAGSCERAEPVRGRNPVPPRCPVYGRSLRQVRLDR